MDIARSFEDTVCSSVFAHFSAVSEEDIKKLVTRSSTTTCDLDPLPSDLVKKCIDFLLPVITSIINNSLESGAFPDPLLYAIVLRLLKKLGLDLIFPSYSRVSKLSIMSIQGYREAGCWSIY